MMAAWHQLPRIRAERMLEAVQVQSAQHMKAHDRSAWLDRLVEQARGVVAEVGEAMESVFWNGSVMRSARQLKGKVFEAFGRGAAA